ncbi:MAG: type III pantothenate kinase [Marinagarivorans sp.]|nr:type III pantothenate kinase [Marinagarivorans sp.]
MPVIIDVDIGNSFVKWRIAGDENIERQSTASLAGGWNCKLAAPSRVRVASVADREITQLFCRQLQEQWSVEVEIASVRANIGGIAPCYADLTRLGVDRWLAMLAAYRLAGSACVVVSAGSALTADWLNAEGLHLGGWIAPGRQKMLDILHFGVANVLTEPVVASSPAVLGLGVNTSDCVLQGVNTLLAGFIAKVAEREVNAPLFLAGGDASILIILCAPEHKSRIRLMPNLVLDGLAIAMP